MLRVQGSTRPVLSERISKLIAQKCDQKQKIEPTKKKPEPFAIYVFLIFYMKETEKKKCVYSNACDFSSICTRRVLDCCLLRSLDVVPLKTSIFYGRNDRLLADNVIEISLWYGKVFSPIPPVILPKLIVQGFFFFVCPLHRLLKRFNALRRLKCIYFPFAVCVRVSYMYCVYHDCSLRTAALKNSCLMLDALTRLIRRLHRRKFLHVAAAEISNLNGWK